MQPDPAVELLGSMTALVRAARAVAQRSSGELGAAGTPLGVLKRLRAGDARPSDLATALRIGPSVVSRALLPLEQQGLVERTADPVDARANLIRLTDRGRARLDALQQLYVDQIRAMLADWSDDEVEQAATTLRRLERAISAPARPTARRPGLSSVQLPFDAVADAVRSAATDAALTATR